jgi:hypothetical protein
VGEGRGHALNRVLDVAGAGVGLALASPLLAVAGLAIKLGDGGPILVAGSRTLVHALMEHGLVDEFHFWIFPVVAGGGGDEAQQLKSAADAAARAAEESPKDFDAQMKAAMVYRDMGEFDEAAGFLARANALRPEDLDVRSELAVTYFMRKPPQQEKAISELRRNLETDPSHLPSLHNLTRMLIETKRLDEAEATLSEMRTTLLPVASSVAEASASFTVTVKPSPSSLALTAASPAPSAPGATTKSA